MTNMPSQCPAKDLTDRNTNTLYTRQQSRGHEILRIRVQLRHHARPDYSKGVEHACPDTGNDGCGVPALVGEEVHWHQGFSELFEGFPEYEEDEADEADNDAGNDMSGGPGVDAAAPIEA